MDADSDRDSTASSETVAGIADAKLRHAELDAEAKLRDAEFDAAARLRQADVDAEAKLRDAEIDAELVLRRAEIPAAAMLLQAESDAAATLLHAGEEAEATLRRAEIPAAAKLRQAEVDAAATLLQAEIPAAAKLLEAEASAQAIVRQAEDEARCQHDVFERFFALSIDMMCISTSSDGYVIRCNSSFEVLGYSDAEMRSRSILDHVHPDDRALTQSTYQALSPENPTITFENRYRCKDGTYCWLSWASGLESSGVVYSMARDITKAKHSHDAMVRAKNAVQEANRELESFSYSVAHDLRAPLRSIDGFSQALLEDYVEKLDATGTRYLTVIRESACHMSQLIDDLLGLSRVTRGEMRREPIDLSTLARAASERLQASQPGRVVDIVIQDGMNDEGDPRLLAIVLDNLLGNAWKFSSKRAYARIEFGARDKDGQLAYFIRDNGAGFDMARANQLFGVFLRLHTAEDFEGTGVGLATVQRIIGRHGGRVWAEAEVDHGATFYFTLHEPPAATDAAGAI